MKFATQDQWRRWLAAEHGDRPDGVGIEMAKKASGIESITHAEAVDGRWDAAYEPPATATVPDDLRAALDADSAAAEFFASLSGSNRYAILHRVHDAKPPETRARRIAKFVAMCVAGERIH